MADVDPETLLEWLTMGLGQEELAERDMQLVALEQLCMLLLMSDNVDRCFERYVSPPFLFCFDFCSTIHLSMLLCTAVHPGRFCRPCVASCWTRQRLIRCWK